MVYARNGMPIVLIVEVGSTRKVRVLRTEGFAICCLDNEKRCVNARFRLFEDGLKVGSMSRHGIFQLEIVW
jgi:hypothetical protein